MRPASTIPKELTMNDTHNDGLAAMGAVTQAMAERVSATVAGQSQLEQAHAAEFLVAAQDLAVEMWFQKGDPASPYWTNWERPWRKFGGDNPGTTYFSAPVSARHRYRVAGDVGGAHYVGLQLYGQVQGFNAPTANISSHDLHIGDDGRFELFLGGERPDGEADWLPLADNDYVAMVRVYTYEVYPEWHVTIERLDDSAVEPLSVSERLAKALGAAERLAKAASYFEAEVLSSLELTELIALGGTNGYGGADATYRQPEYGDALFPTLDNKYEGFFVDIAPDEALVLHGRLPKAHYCSLVFYDRWWATPAYPQVHCYRTDRSLEYNPDGTYDAVIAATDPGVPNWLDTGGLTQGVFASRYLLGEVKLLPEVSVVKLADVPDIVAKSRG
jgi:hypothetical protein